MEQENNQVKKECCDQQCNGSCKSSVSEKSWKDLLALIVVFAGMFALIIWLTNKDYNQVKKMENISPPVIFNGQKHI